MAFVVQGLTEAEEMALHREARKNERSVAGQVRLIIRQWLAANGLVPTNLGSK